jgi:hypothetical protein
MRARLTELQATNSNQNEIAELVVRIGTESSKRERWAVRFLLFVFIKRNIDLVLLFLV